MALSSSFKSLMTEQLAPLGSVEIRPMFGGAAVRLDGNTFGLIDDDVLYFKVDATTLVKFEAEDMPPFTYQSKNGPMTMAGYRRAPDRLFDEPDEFLVWARAAIAVAQRTSKPKKPPKAKPAAAGRRAKPPK